MKNKDLGALQVWLIRALIKDYGELRRRGVIVPRVSVKLSLRRLTGPGLRKIGQIVSKAHLPLQVEIPENDLTDYLAVGADFGKLVALKKMGIGIAVDDFGTGYSSLAYLKKAPFDALKIDGSLIRDLPTSSETTSIVSSIVSIGRIFGVKVVAEGVENENQATLLRERGCDELQGLWFAEPMPLSDLCEFIATRHDP
jgi:EAL domain-containing protein (putative c-di-GMP-specific phosphodiesterase class I)